MHDSDTNSQKTAVYRGGALAAYGFGSDHPFGTDRHDAFFRVLATEPLEALIDYQPPAHAQATAIASFHTQAYIERVARLSEIGKGWLDEGDTPAFPGVMEAASTVVGTTLAATDRIMSGAARNAFVPIGGLHHAARGHAAGFCVFNDCGVAIAHLRQKYGLKRIAYVDMDAHHGDGVFYGFEDDPDQIFADIHEDGRYLYPGTGDPTETGQGPAAGTKLNICLAPGAGDDEYAPALAQVVAHIERFAPEFILFQCGADAMAGDPITHLALTEHSYRSTTRALLGLADRSAAGRLLALGGGGYNRDNLGCAWTAVVAEMARHKTL